MVEPSPRRCLSIIIIIIIRFNFDKNPKQTSKALRSITGSLFFSSGRAASLTTNGEPCKHLGKLCCHQNYLRIKLYIYTLLLVELLCHWQQCIASLSTISLERINACYTQNLSRHPSIRRNKIAFLRMLSLETSLKTARWKRSFKGKKAPQCKP